VAASDDARTNAAQKGEGDTDKADKAGAKAKGKGDKKATPADDESGEDEE